MFIGVDLGTTNIKAALYSENMELADRKSSAVEYLRDGKRVEFDADAYFNILTELLERLISDNGVKNVREIAFTGQAETLVCIGRDGKPLINAISWMDERSQSECAELAEIFPQEVCERITGQQAVLPTWPATKILWLKRNMPEIFEKTGTYMLLKDYIVFRLTGVKKCDMSIATFSFYFDIYEKKYWADMLEAIGITEEKLPELAEPCSFTGNLLPEISGKLNLEGETRINCGTLDHFAGMIGTGNIDVGGVTLSTGTVMAFTAMASEPAPRNSGIAMHYGFLPDTHVMLPVVESGGVSLEWFKRTCMGETGYDEMNEVLASRGENDLIFLPYIAGTNAPEFDSDATGMFWGLRQEHDKFDMARAVMEGVSFTLRKNTDLIAEKGTRLKSIIATGGGAKSDIWCRLHADITGLPVLVPKEKEAACLGAAIIAAVDAGKYADFYEATKDCVLFDKEFKPHKSEKTEAKYRRFNFLYDASVKAAGIK